MPSLSPLIPNKWLCTIDMVRLCFKINNTFCLFFFLDVFLSNWINIGQFVVAFNSNYSIYRTWPSLFNKTILEWHLFIFNKTKFCRLKKNDYFGWNRPKKCFPLCERSLFEHGWHIQPLQSIYFVWNISVSNDEHLERACRLQSIGFSLCTIRYV